MQQALYTILAALIVLGLGFLCLAIGKVITGKWMLRKSGCSRFVDDKMTGKDSSCTLCGGQKNQCKKDFK